MIMESMELQLLASHNWQVLRAARLTALLDSPDAFTSSYAYESGWGELEWRRMFDAATWIVAREAGQVIGLARSISEPGQAVTRHVESIWVARTHRRRGVFRALLQAVAETERLRNVTDLAVWVSEENYDARHAFLALGFEPTGERQFIPAFERFEQRLRLGITWLPDPMSPRHPFVVNDEESFAIVSTSGSIELLSLEPVPATRFRDHKGNVYNQIYYLGSQWSPWWKNIIDEFEELINSPRVRESDLQRFFERNPELLHGDTYEEARSHIVLHRDGQGPLIPDFALRPSNPAALCDLLELKLPQKELLVGPPSRRRLSAAVMEAAAQLREYQAYFDVERHRNMVEKAYGLRFFRPQMIVVIGKRIKYPALDLRAAETDVPNLTLTTYDDLLERARNRAKRPWF